MKYMGQQKTIFFKDLLLLNSATIVQSENLEEGFLSVADIEAL